MELLQLKYFCDAAKTENFSKTAERFLVPTSDISQTVKRLESELGVELFDRRSNKITLNARGRAFYCRASVALEQLADARAELADSVAGVTGEIRLLVCANRRIVTRAIEIFGKRYPNVTFIISHRAEGKRDGYDLIISDSVPSGEGYTEKLLITERFLLALRKDHPLADADTIDPSELSRASFISMDKESSISRTAERICRDLGFEPKVTVRVDDPYYVRKYVSMGLGVALFPEFSWNGQFDEEVALRSVGSYARSTYAYLKRDRYATLATKEFLNTLSELCKEESEKISEAP